MGLDLTIMPLRDRSQLESRTVLCYERLRFDRNYQIFGQVADANGESAIPDLKIKPVVRTYLLPPNMFLEIYEDEGIERTRENHCGEEMVYTFVEQMRKLKLPENTSQRNKAILAYLNELESDTPVILEWS